ncbi:HAD family hydrolase [Aquella oligotrophica]|uniref:Haloacid dehalogenase n=1 Tax=Aquella oligotrophica TaxID=2067065 RepID=A0A2I7N8Q3_9NEIS|nr:HAD-IA family hydrolase [Aquella oligotrophica]AUR52828.1 haloacid dehalogenase [Aquella oligotrophica]
MMKKYTTILFDLDDTLLDFVSAEKKTLRYIHQEYYSNYEFENFLKTYQTINNNLWEQVGSGHGSILPRDVRYRRFIDLHATLKTDLNHEIVAHSFENYLGVNTDWIDGVEKVIDLLAGKGYRLGIITNGLTSVQYLKYKTNLLHQWFECFVVSDEVGVAKPGREIFEIAFAQMNLKDQDVAQILYVGDSLASDGYGAKNAGIDFAFINRKKLAVENHDLQIHFNLDTVADLSSLL